MNEFRYYPTVGIVYDTRFKQALEGMINKFEQLDEDNMDAEFMGIDYQVALMKGIAREKIKLATRKKVMEVKPFNPKDIAGYEEYPICVRCGNPITTNLHQCVDNEAPNRIG